MRLRVIDDLNPKTIEVITSMTLDPSKCDLVPVDIFKFLNWLKTQGVLVVVGRGASSNNKATVVFEVSTTRKIEPKRFDRLMGYLESHLNKLQEGWNSSA